MNSVILAIGLCQIHMQAVEYILGDQPLNFEQVSDSLFDLYKLSQLWETGCG